MVKKAIVEEVLPTSGKVIVRIPDFETISGEKFTEDAIICCKKGFSVDYKKGDTVYVSFENNSYTSPVVLGFLNSVEDVRGDASLNALYVEGIASIGDNISIGNVKYDNIKTLKGLDYNLQQKIDSLDEDNRNILELISKNNMSLNDISAKLRGASDKNRFQESAIHGITRLIGEKDDLKKTTLFGIVNGYLKKIDEYYKLLGYSLSDGVTIMDDLNDIIDVLGSLEGTNDLIAPAPVQHSGKEPLQCMMTNSVCYKNTTVGNPVGILWHSTGCDNPNICRYVQPDDDDPNRESLLSKIGTNKVGSDWNHAYVKAGLNAWVGKLSDGSVASVQTMPWNYRPWGCGMGSKGSCNGDSSIDKSPFWIQFEICEDNHKSRDYFNKAYNEAVALTAYLCEKFKIDPYGTVYYKGVNVPTILCHNDSNKLGLGSNHYDVYNWFPTFGKCKDLTMDQVRKDINVALHKRS